ncbi:MAG: ABC transporter ATP-binding protein [Burkholderiales bacterium]|nr:ABC transporter ATP-binding protein [Burkholderiales bacterium]
MIRLDRVTRRYAGPPPRLALAQVSLAVAEGEFVAIVGESGTGKSTLLNLVAGLDLPDSGSVSVEGTELTTLDDDARTLFRRAHIGFVFQAFHVLAHLTVAQNVALPLALLGHDAGATRARVTAMLAAVGLDDRGASMPHELSGGELQRTAIARALVHRPAVVLADEPTGNLDPVNADRILALLRECVRAEGATCLLVTHSHHAAARADRSVTLTGTGLRAVAVASAPR